MTGKAESDIGPEQSGSLNIAGKIFPAVTEEGADVIPSGSDAVVIGFGHDCLVVAKPDADK